MKHKWISNEAQPGVQTDIGLWHTLPHPDLAVQVMRKGDAKAAVEVEA